MVDLIQQLALIANLTSAVFLIAYASVFGGEFI